MGNAVLRFAAAWALSGVFLGIVLGAWTAWWNGFTTFADALRLHAALVAAFGGLAAVAGIGLGSVMGAVGRALRRPAGVPGAGTEGCAFPAGGCDPAGFGFATAVALTGATYALRRFELDAAYPRHYPFADDFGAMFVVASGFLVIVGIAAAAGIVVLSRGAEALDEAGRFPRLRTVAGAAGVLLVGSCAAIALRPGTPAPGRDLTRGDPTLRPRPAGPVATVSASAASSRLLPSDSPAPAGSPVRVAASRAPILLVGCDGAEATVLGDLFARGELPNLRGLAAGGARGLLRTIPGRPSPSVWTSIATGKSPEKHGIWDFDVRRLAGSSSPVALFPRHFGRPLSDFFGERLVRVTPVNRTMVRAAPLWRILAARGISVGVVNWPVTWPAGTGPALVVTDRSFAAARRGEGAGVTATGWGAGPAAWFPPEIGRVIAAALDDPEARRFEDAFVGAVARRLHDLHHPDVLIAYFRDVDAAEHLHWDEYQPRFFRGVARTGGADPVTAAYRRFDRILGDLIELAGEDATVVVVSDHGHGPWFTWLGRGTPGGHTDSPDGIFLAAGPGIRPGAVPRLASCYDVAPTLLHLAGLPVPGDMDGRVLSEIFAEGSPGAAPVRVVTTYEPVPGGEARPAVGTEAAAESDAEVLEGLRALGYLR